MPSRLILVASAGLLAAAGLVATFLPEELLTWLGAPAATPLPALLQVAGGLCLGFAMLNWMSRGNRHGGIYGRPLVLANLLQFWVSGLALLKGASALPIFIAGAVCLAFGAAFGWLLFGDPR
jgi:hypothetical protein